MEFTYNRGSWEEGNPLSEWKEDEDFEVYLDRVGFDIRETCFGDEDGKIEIFESTDGKSFYASVCPTGNIIYEVYLPDFISLMMFIKEYAPAFSNESSNSNSQDIFQLLGKLFRVYHGHDAHSICYQCDPIGWEMKQFKKGRI